jgi:hypothetical protein
MKKFLLGLGIAMAPAVALAQSAEDVASRLAGLSITLTGLVNSVIPFLLAIAVVVFIWGVIKYMIQSSPEDKAAGRSYIIWGIIGIAVILSIFGLVRLLQNTFNIQNTQLRPSDIPKVIP